MGFFSWKSWKLTESGSLQQKIIFQKDTIEVTESKKITNGPGPRKQEAGLYPEQGLISRYKPGAPHLLVF